MPYSASLTSALPSSTTETSPNVTVHGRPTKPNYCDVNCHAFSCDSEGLVNTMRFASRSPTKMWAAPLVIARQLTGLLICSGRDAAVLNLQQVYKKAFITITTSLSNSLFCVFNEVWHSTMNSTSRYYRCFTACLVRHNVIKNRTSKSCFQLSATTCNQADCSVVLCDFFCMAHKRHSL